MAVIPAGWRSLWRVWSTAKSRDDGDSEPYPMWDARGLALIALVRGDKDEAARIMAHAKGMTGKTKTPVIDAARKQQ